MTALARLSFWVPPERMDEFQTTYEKKVLPVLKKHDLIESSEPGRKTVEGVFSRLFEFETPAEIAARERSLREDPAWQEILLSLGTDFGTSQPDGLLRAPFRIYRTPAGSGKTVEAGPGYRQGLWQSFSVTDGFPYSIILDISQDRKGNLWFGVQRGGVSCYDGAQFTTFTTEDGLAGDFVWSTLEDREGILWFGTNEGLSRYDGNEFITFTTEDGLAHNTVWSILENQEGDLWFGTRGGLSCYDREKFITFTSEDGLAGDNVGAIAQDHEGNLWFGSNGGGVSRYDGERFVNFRKEDGLADNRVRSIVEDREGNIWFGTYGGGASCYDGEKFVTFTTKDGLASNLLCSIVEDREGNLWFGPWAGGVSRYDGARFRTFNNEDGLVANIVYCILEDREGYLWFGTGTGGVSRYDGVQFRIFTTEDGLRSNCAIPVLEDREGNLWFASFGGGASRYDGKQFVIFTTEDGLADNDVISILEDREGNFWFGSWKGGVSRYDGKEFTTFTVEDGLGSNWVKPIVEDREGHLWFGTQGGISRYDGKEFVNFTVQGGLMWSITKQDAQKGNWVWSIMEDKKGHLWFGTEVGGVIQYDGKEFTIFTAGGALANNRVWCILEDREGNVWFGTTEGVSRYDGKELVTFTTEDGLTHNSVQSILEDRDGNLWFGTFGGGVNIYDGLVLQSLSKKDGLANNTVYRMIQDRNGDIWIGSDNGVTRYRPKHTSPTIHIKEVIADQRYGPVGEISLPSSQKFIVFEFRGRSLSTHPDRIAYVYKLTGYDSDWQVTYTGRVEYQDLPLGEYTFEVKAVDRDLNYSEPATARVTVEPDPRLEAFVEALSGTPDEFVGNSEALRRVQEQLIEVAPTDMTVLISGETGTGKGLAARTIHGIGPRKADPFIQVNCGAIPENLVESELFGHERGAFTGAVSRKLGKVELAEGGTLFLDEIGDLAMTAQAKLLRFLEEQTFERVGGTETLQVDVRVIAATNRDLRKMVEAGTFREDLYFRLQGFQIELPLLSERREDIPLLTKYFMERMASHLSKEVTHLTPEALSVFQSYDWPGNVRELEHAVKRAVIVCQGPAISPEDIALESGSTEGGAAEEILSLEELERHHIRKVLERTGWVIRGKRGAAVLLGLPPSTLYDRMKKLGIVRP